MKLFLSLLAIFSTGLAMAADLDDYTPTPRDEAVALLASKRTEADLLHSELDAKKQDLDQQTKAVDQARASWDAVRKGYVPGQPDNDLQETTVTLRVTSDKLAATQARIQQINDRLKALDTEIKQAKENLQRIIGGKSDSRSNLRPQSNARPSTTRPSAGDKCGMHP